MQYHLQGGLARPHCFKLLYCVAYIMILSTAPPPLQQCSLKPCSCAGLWFLQGASTVLLIGILGGTVVVIGLLGVLTHTVGTLYHDPKLAPRYRELAYLRASQLNSCHY